MSNRPYADRIQSLLSVGYPDQDLRSAILNAVTDLRHLADAHKTSLKAWTYTHRWMTLKRKAFDGISVLASCETMLDVFNAHLLGYAPALVVPKFESLKAYDLPNSFTGIPCPAQTKAQVTCQDCKLCLKSDWLHSTRRVILFEAHGARGRKLAEKLVQIEVKGGN